MKARDALRATAISERDARILLAHAWDVDRAKLSLLMDDILPEDVAARFATLAASRADSVPVSKLIGRRAFWKDDFIITKDVLDPRPETETLVELAIAEPFERVLDLGTGSGCILLSLLKEQGAARGVGVDLSNEALEVARRNAVALGCANRADLIASDWFAGVDGMFDLIVSNPPYISQDEMAVLSREVAEHDPHLALTPGGDGLAAYRKIIGGLAGFLTPDGRLIVEIGPTQAAAVEGLMRGAGLEDITVTQDLDGRDRVVSGRNGYQAAPKS